jgi:hypothetical protein
MRLCLLLLSALLIPVLVWGQGLDEWEALSVRNTFSLSVAGYWNSGDRDADLRLSWMPELALDLQLANFLWLNADLSMDNQVSASFAGHASEQDISIDMYRGWLSLSTSLTSLRGGLQHIQIGPARVLRPLQWFDRLRPNDLFAFSKGVRGILLTHHFPNPNLRFWAIKPEGDLPANMLLPSADKSIEFGGRLELRTPLGESGFSFHHRDLGEMALAKSESRLGFDHRVDGVIGAWLETSASLIGEPDPMIPSATVSATLGCDYTVGIGQGIYLLMEHNLLSNTCSSIPKLRYRGVNSAVMGTYPTGLLDTVILLGTWDWENGRGSGSLAWRRMYDYLSLELGITLDGGMEHVDSEVLSAHLKVALDL